MTAMRALLMSLALAAPTASAASFGCNQASSQVEKLICGDPALSALDQQLRRSYEAARVRVGDEPLVRQWQRHWLELDDVAACADAGCLAALWQARVALLDGAIASPWNGRYQRMNGKKIDRHGASVFFIGQRDGGAVVWGSALWVGINGPLGGVHYGAIHGVARATGTTLVYQDDACEISFTRIKGGLKLSDNFRCGGHNVTFGGRYTGKGR